MRADHDSSANAISIAMSDVSHADTGDEVHSRARSRASASVLPTNSEAPAPDEEGARLPLAQLLASGLGRARGGSFLAPHRESRR